MLTHMATWQSVVTSCALTALYLCKLFSRQKNQSVLQKVPDWKSYASYFQFIQKNLCKLFSVHSTFGNPDWKSQIMKIENAATFFHGKFYKDLDKIWKSFLLCFSLLVHLYYPPSMLCSTFLTFFLQPSQWILTLRATV